MQARPWWPFRPRPHPSRDSLSLRQLGHRLFPPGALVRRQRPSHRRRGVARRLKQGRDTRQQGVGGAFRGAVCAGGGD
eukprot:scaffold5072_cov80-Isochrysis_galbana.AAC.1